MPLVPLARHDSRRHRWRHQNGERVFWIIHRSTEATLPYQCPIQTEFIYFKLFPGIGTGSSFAEFLIAAGNILTNCQRAWEGFVVLLEAASIQNQ